MCVRFRTDFFLIYVENEVDIIIDKGETVAYKWFTPLEAIQKQKNGEIFFVEPQFFILTKLLAFKTGKEAVEFYGRKSRDEEFVEIQSHSIGEKNDYLVLSLPGVSNV